MIKVCLPQNTDLCRITHFIAEILFSVCVCVLHFIFFSEVEAAYDYYCMVQFLPGNESVLKRL